MRAFFRFSVGLCRMNLNFWLTTESTVSLAETIQRSVPIDILCLVDRLRIEQFNTLEYLEEVIRTKLKWLRLVESEFQLVSSMWRGTQNNRFFCWNLLFEPKFQQTTNTKFRHWCANAGSRVSSKLNSKHTNGSQTNKPTRNNIEITWIESWYSLKGEGGTTWPTTNNN